MRLPVLPLFATAARAANQDPVTSKVAATVVEDSGHADDQRQKVLAVVLAHPMGLTSIEVAPLAHLDRYQAARRLPELAEMGLVAKQPDPTQKDGLAKRAINGRPSVVWVPVQQGRGAIFSPANNSQTTHQSNTDTREIRGGGRVP